MLTRIIELGYFSYKVIFVVWDLCIPSLVSTITSKLVLQSHVGEEDSQHFKIGHYVLWAKSRPVAS